jgi:hypothetical protein
MMANRAEVFSLPSAMKHSVDRPQSAQVNQVQYPFCRSAPVNHAQISLDWYDGYHRRDAFGRSDFDQVSREESVCVSRLSFSRWLVDPQRQETSLVSHGEPHDGHTGGTTTTKLVAVPASLRRHGIQAVGKGLRRLIECGHVVALNGKTSSVATISVTTPQAT